MAESLRDADVGPEWLAYYALTADEPIRFAKQYLASAHERLGRALSLCRDKGGTRLVPKEAEQEIAAVRLFLIGLASAADPDQKTPVNLKLDRRRGRPRRNIKKITAYRQAAHRVLKLKPRGYEAAVTEVAKDTGLDATEIEAWASSLERQMQEIGLSDK